MIMEDILTQAIELWEANGAVSSTSWAISEDKVAYATAADAEGAEISAEQRIGLQAMLAACIDAVYIGRIDETWTRIQDEGKPFPVSGELGAIADRDPTVVTALCVEALDLSDGSLHVHLARLRLEDDGSVGWDRSTSALVDPRIVGGSKLTAQLIPEVLKNGRPRPDDLADLMETLHWAMAIGGEDYE
jgi:hypothetical protein